MTIVQAILLGLIQGLTEFLPVSSSAHLTLAGTLMGLISAEHPEHWTAFIAVIQLGTLVAVLWYFGRDILAIASAFVQENLMQRKTFAEQSLHSRLGWYVIVGSLPIATVGLALKKVIEGAISKNLTVIAVGLMVLAVLMALAERFARHSKSLEELTWKDALVVGVAQVLALIPGPSRSGTTLTAGLLLGMKRDVAARFSFLLSIPAIAGSGLLELRHAVGVTQGVDATALVLATLVAGLSGYAAIAFLLRFLQTRTVNVFVVYRLLLGGVILAFLRS